MGDHVTSSGLNMASSMLSLHQALGKGIPASFLVLLCCLLGVQTHSGDWNSLNDDLLLPYHPPHHGPQHHLRFPRDCQGLIHGHTAHESWLGDNSTHGISAMVTTHGFVSYFPPEGLNQRPVYGHYTVARDPLRTFSVLEPGGQGGCHSRSRVTVEETARRGKCLVAQNGGYFDMDTGACLGNVVSDGRLVQTSRGVQNAQFGIRKDGTLVFGYLSEDEVLAKENPFVQLVSGVVWLLRNGEVYVNQSRTVECNETQESGSFDLFINTLSARTAVGHDAQGRLILMHVDGQTGGRGLNLWEMAAFLKKLGAVNAINLDGGGSATLVLNGTLASYPSDHCASDPMWRCPRHVTTVVCIHEPTCQPLNCSGHGECVLGECQCSGAFWKGPACSELDCGPTNCSLHGVCTETGCLCDAGWMGSNCSEECMGGFYGDGCAQKCLCRNGGECDPVHGSCSCPAGYKGPLCEEVCQVGQYGSHCQHTCQCPNQCPCDPKTGSCNISYDSIALDKLARARQCWLTANHKEGLVFTQKTWIGVTSVLALLLLLSMVGNVRSLLYSCTEQHNRNNYTYLPLRDMNGDTSDDCPSATWEKEDPTRNTSSLNQTEVVEVLQQETGGLSP